jgi:hypothetical protein
VFPPLCLVVPRLHPAGSRRLGDLLLQPPQLGPCLRALERQVGQPAQEQAIEPELGDRLDDADGRARFSRHTPSRSANTPRSWSAPSLMVENRGSANLP